MNYVYRFFSLLILFVFLTIPPAESKVIQKTKMSRFDFSNAVILTTDTLSAPAAQAVEMLVDEVARRTGIQLPVQHEWPDASHACIAIGKLPEQAFLQGTYKISLSELDEPGPEGYKLRAIVGSRQVCWIVGTDDRGVLYGVGSFLRTLHFSAGNLWLSHDLETSQTPAAGIRASRLVLSPSLDSDAASTITQHIRELALFGANYIAVSVPDFPGNLAESENISQQMAAVFRACENYALDMGVNCSAEIVRTASRRQQLADLLEPMPRIKGIFITNYDIATVSPDSFFNSINTLAEQLSDRHSSVKMWLPLPDGRRSAQMDLFYSLLNATPKWLGGVICKSASTDEGRLENVRQRITAEIPLICSPDIVSTPGKPFFHRGPEATAKIHQQIHALTNGSISASASLFDDVNTFVWLARAWDPKAAISGVLREYARFFIDDAYADGIAMGLLALEKNSQPPLAISSQISTTFRQWRLLEQALSMKSQENVRFQAGLLQAYYDAALQIRQVHEMNVQHEAEAVLRKAPEIGARKAVKKALHIFEHQHESEAVMDLEKKCRQIIKTLEHSPKNVYSDSFDAVLAGMKRPLNDSRWYMANLRAVRRIAAEPERLIRISELLNRTNPGLGGYYVNAGEGTVSADIDQPVPMAWLTTATGTAENPFELTFENLNPFLQYRIRVVYPTWTESTVALTASKKFKIHPLQKFEQPVQEFAIPRRAISQGRVSFAWTCGRGEAGAKIAEVWLFPEKESIKSK